MEGLSDVSPFKCNWDGFAEKRKKSCNMPWLVSYTYTGDIVEFTGQDATH